MHCVVWAKHIFAVLFGPEDKENIMNDLKKDLKDDDGHVAIMQKLFETDIEFSLQIKSRWETRKAPVPLKVVELLSSAFKEDENSVLRDQRVLSVAENAHVFANSVKRIYDERKTDIGSMVFDKDDDLAMDFVSSLANMRMNVFHIPMQSRFAIKGIAGNIVHAIATTNAVAAGLIVVEAMKVRPSPSLQNPFPLPSPSHTISPLVSTIIPSPSSATVIAITFTSTLIVIINFFPITATITITIVHHL